VLISDSKQVRAPVVVMSPKTFWAVTDWSNTTAIDETDPVSGRAKVAERARAPMVLVRLVASGPAQRSKGLSVGAALSPGAGLVTVKPGGTSAWTSSARRARSAGASAGGAVVVVTPPGAAAAGVVVVLEDPGAGAVPGSGRVGGGVGRSLIRVSAWTAGPAAR